jgi:hypothetical protein
MTIMTSMRSRQFKTSCLLVCFSDALSKFFFNTYIYNYFKYVHVCAFSAVFGVVKDIFSAAKPSHRKRPPRVYKAIIYFA